MGGIAPTDVWALIDTAFARLRVGPSSYLAYAAIHERALAKATFLAHFHATLIRHNFRMLTAFTPPITEADHVGRRSARTRYPR